VVRKDYFLALSLERTSEVWVDLTAPPPPGTKLEVGVHRSVFGAEELEGLCLEA